MATTFREYNAPATYSFTFPSYQSSDVKVRVDGVLKTAGTHYNITGYTTTGGGTVVFIDNSGSGGTNHTPSSPSKVRVYRDTNVETAKAEYTPGSSVKAADLNNNHKQLLYRAQEEQVPNLIQSYDVAASAIETSNIKDANVTTAKIVDSNVTTAKIADSNITTAKIADSNVTRAKIAADAIDSTKLADNAVNSEHYVDGSIDRVHLAADIVDGTKIADNSIDSEHYVDGSIDVEHLADNSVDRASIVNDAVNGDKIADDSINSEHYVDGSIDEQHLSNSAITSNKIADNAVTTTEILNGAVTRAKLEADIIDGTKLADNAIDSEHYTDGSIDRIHLEADIIDSTKLADNAVNSEHYVDGSIDREHLAAGIVDGTKIAAAAISTDKVENNAITDSKIATGTLDNRYFTETELANGALDGRYFTETESDARYFNISSGETIKDGDTFPDNDTTIATTAAINDRIIDLIDDVGGFDIIQSEQHFPNTNPQGTTGQSAVLSIKAASTNLVPSGTTVTISNGNLANNANITITGVTSTIPTGFGFLVESTSTTHTYAFHRLVPKATEVTTVAGNITNINAAANNETNINAAVSNASNINAAVSNASNITAVAGNASNINAAVSNASNINAAVSNASNITTTASNITNVNNVGNNVTNVNSVSNSAGANQTFTVTSIIQSGSVRFHIDGVRLAVLKLARGKTYIFDQSDSSNSGHPLRFRDSSNNAYTSGVTASGTAGSSGATVTFVVPSNAPSTLRYYCTSHGNVMGNTINVIDDNVGTVAGSISNVNTVGGAISNVNTTATNISNVNTVASNISNVNSFFNVYRIGSSNPTSSLDTGDLFFNTSTNSLKVYTGSAWVDGVTTTGDFALKTGNTFTGSNIYNDNVKALFGTGSDLEIFHDGSHSRIKDVGTGNLFIHGTNTQFLNAAGSETIAKFTENAAVELWYDGSRKLETTSGGVTVTGSATISSGQPALYFTDTTDNPDFSIKNADGVFRIIDETNNAARFNVLQNGTVDIAGNVDVYNGIDLPVDNKSITFGASADLSMKHDGTNSYILNNTGSFTLSADTLKFNNRANNETKALFINNGAVELYYDSSKKFETTTTGIKIFSGGQGLDEMLRLDAGGNSQGHGSKMAFARAGDVRAEIQAVKVETSHNETDIVFKTTKTGSLFEALRIVGDTGHIQIPADNKKLLLGAGQDLELYHTGTNSFIDNNTGHLYLRNKVNNQKVIVQAGIGGNAELNVNYGEHAVNGIANGSTKLYYDNAVKLQTESHGNTLFGTQQNLNGDVKFDNQTNAGMDLRWDESLNRLHFEQDNIKAVFGTGSDLEIYHNGSQSKIIDTQGNELRLNADTIRFRDKDDGDTYANFIHDGAVELYHDNNKKFETTSTGVTVTGTVAATSYTGDGSNLSGINTDLVSDTSPQLGGNLDCQTNNISLNDSANSGSGRIRWGGNSDLQIYHDGTHSYITNNTGTLYNFANTWIVNNYDNSENFIRAFNNGAVQLYYDGSNKLQTYANGVKIQSDGNTGRLVLADTSGNFAWQLTGFDEGSAGTGGRGVFQDAQGGTVLDMRASGSNIHSYNTIKLNGAGTADNLKVTFGAGDDLQIYHDGSNSYIDEVGTGGLRIRTSQFVVRRYDNNNDMLIANSGGSVDLYYDNVKKFETRSGGAAVFGHLELGDSNKVMLGNSNDLQIYHDGAESYVKNTNSNSNLILEGAHGVDIKHGSENMAKFKPDAAVELYYDNAKKFETAAHGITVSGRARLSQPYAKYYGVNNASGAGGWKTFQWRVQQERRTISHSNSISRFTPDQAGWYLVVLNHYHQNGTHSDYYLRITRNGTPWAYRKFHMAFTGNLSAIMYFNGSSDYFEMATYHSNSSHPDENNENTNFGAIYLTQ